MMWVDWFTWTDLTKEKKKKTSTILFISCEPATKFPCPSLNNRAILCSAISRFFTWNPQTERRTRFCQMCSLTVDWAFVCVCLCVCVRVSLFVSFEIQYANVICWNRRDEHLLAGKYHPKSQSTIWKEVKSKRTRWKLWLFFCGRGRRWGISENRSKHVQCGNFLYAHILLHWMHVKQQSQHM